MSFKPFNDIIILLCKFPIKFCCLRSYPTYLCNLKSSDIYSSATYILKRHIMLNDIILKRQNVLNEMNDFNRHNLLIRHNYLNDINLRIKIMRHKHVAQFNTT